MKIKNNKNLLAAAAILVAFLIIVWFSDSIHGGEKTYEIRPEIAIPEYRTDAARAIDAYERMMDRFMDMTERNFMDVNTDTRRIAEKLNSIDCKLAELCTRTAKIEKMLAVQKSKKSSVMLKAKIHQPTEKTCSQKKHDLLNSTKSQATTSPPQE